MALVGYKTRPRLHSWEAPEPPPPKRTRLLAVGLVAWFGAIYLGYRWLESSDTTLLTGEQDTNGRDLQPPVPPRDEPAALAVVPPTAIERPTVNATRPPTEPLPSCESFLSEARSNDQERMPAHLGRSLLAQFLGDSEWTRPCRGRKRRSTVKFCAAIRDGAIVGLSLESAPKSLGLETCIREQALALSVRSEPTVRIVELTLDL